MNNNKACSNLSATRAFKSFDGFDATGGTGGLPKLLDNGKDCHFDFSTRPRWAARSTPSGASRRRT